MLMVIHFWVISHRGSSIWRSLLAAQNSPTKGCPPRRHPLHYTTTRYISFEVYFLIVSIQIESHRSRCLPKATQSTLHHYFITSYTEINVYLLIIDKLSVIRYQATVKQSALIFDDASWPACSQTITIVLFCSKESTISSRLLTDLNSFVTKQLISIELIRNASPLKNSHCII